MRGAKVSPRTYRFCSIQFRNPSTTRIISSFSVQPEKRTVLFFKAANGAGAVTPVFSVSCSSSTVPGASVCSPNARRTLSQNLNGLAVDSTTVGVLSPVSLRYCSRTEYATAVWGSIR